MREMAERELEEKGEWGGEGEGAEEEWREGEGE